MISITKAVSLFFPRDLSFAYLTSEQGMLSTWWDTVAASR